MTSDGRRRWGQARTVFADHLPPKERIKRSWPAVVKQFIFNTGARVVPSSIFRSTRTLKAHPLDKAGSGETANIHSPDQPRQTSALQLQLQIWPTCDPGSHMSIMPHASYHLRLSSHTHATSLMTDTKYKTTATNASMWVLVQQRCTHRFASQ